MKKIIFITLSLALAGCTSPNMPVNKIFPLDRYDQNVDSWIPPNEENYNIPILTETSQHSAFLSLKSRYFGVSANDESPWNPIFIKKKLAATSEKSIKNIVEKHREKFTSPDSHIYGENFRERSYFWKTELKKNTTIDIYEQFNADNRAIMITESSVRMLPTTNPAFYDFKKAGEGYPFDMLQDSSIRPGTPVYIFGESKDKAWKLIISPAVMGWVKSDDLAKTDETFISQWIAYAKQNLGAFTKEPVSVIDSKGNFRFIAKIGTLLPIKNDKTKGDMVVIPIKNEDGYAKIAYSFVEKDTFSAMPIKTTPKNFAKLIKSMVGKPYGWGNLYFNNDCSSEIRSLMLPFGIFLPRNSADQAQAGKKYIDLSQYSSEERLMYLVKNGKPFTTIIYIRGHVMLYISNVKANGKVIPMTYQNKWGLKPKKKEGRSIIGGSVFLPLLSVYPEDPSLQSLANEKFFKLIYID